MVKTPKRKRLTHRKKKSNATPKAKTLGNLKTRLPDEDGGFRSPTPSTSSLPPLSTPNPTLTPDHVDCVTPTPASRTQTTINLDGLQPMGALDPDSSSSSDEDDDTPSRRPTRSPKTPTSADRIRITRKNAAYDYVVGAMRGSKTLEIPRSRPLREPIDDVARNTRRFNRIITDIIMRCERLGEETGCWLLFLAQLPSSKALTHYSSSRLRREAKRDTLNVINQYQTVIRALLAAKRDEAVKIQKRYEETQRDLDNVQHALVEKEAELALRNAELARYRAAESTPQAQAN
ncbi:hypothetical protein H0H92_013088 [Tricholoma furcatifolium]|nr:hypothetical protein H0H92_013088 [Tricholoma furcatifolium]